MRLGEVIRWVSTDTEEVQRLSSEHFNFKQLATSNASTWGYMLIHEQLPGKCCVPMVEIWHIWSKHYSNNDGIMFRLIRGLPWSWERRDSTQRNGTDVGRAPQCPPHYPSTFELFVVAVRVYTLIVNKPASKCGPSHQWYDLRQVTELFKPVSLFTKWE